MRGFVSKVALPLLLLTAVPFGVSSASAAIVTITGANMAAADNACVSPATRACGYQVAREDYAATQAFNRQVFANRRAETIAWFTEAKKYVSNPKQVNELRKLYIAQLNSAKTDLAASLDLAKSVYWNTREIVKLGYSQ
jgi:hypothetical protein